MIDVKDHWNQIYSTKTPDQMSWTQDYPEASLNLLGLSGLDKEAQIIDIGGGNGEFVRHLLNKGHKNITVLDISKEAVEKSKKRLGSEADKIEWIISDILDFKPIKTYDYWHDRATFHFLTTRKAVDKYVDIVIQAVNPNGYISIGTFSTSGPTKCSGLEIKQYSEEMLTEILKNNFDKVKCITEDHITPKRSVQNFLFCLFKRIR